MTGPDADPDQREWLSLEDPDEYRTWLFDVTFLTSNWTCIYGRGCPGTEPESAPELHLGCCTLGAYLSDETDVAHVRRSIAELHAGTWHLMQHPESLEDPLWQDSDGWWRTKVVDGACIFQNRPEHPGGPGCAFHQLAVERNEPHQRWKPEICWQAPIRREDHETVTGHLYTMIREWERRDWGGESTEIAWWCTDSPAAHVGTDPVFRQMSEELRAICGEVVHARLERALEERLASTSLLPHPTVRRRDGSQPPG